MIPVVLTTHPATGQRLRRGAKRVGPLVELAPRQRAQLIDQARTIRAAPRRDRETEVSVIPPRRTAAAIRRYLSGRSGAISRARRIVATSSWVSRMWSSIAIA
jgi:hypothetical protein